MGRRASAADVTGTELAGHDGRVRAPLGVPIDFKKLVCGALKHKDKLYVIYEGRGGNPGMADESVPPDMQALQSLEEEHKVRV